MIYHKKIRIFFSGKSYVIDKSKPSLVTQASWQQVTDFIQAEKMFGVYQTHGINGIHITKESNQYQSILVDADFLLTNQIGYGLAVTTGDCIPIVIYDPHFHAVALIHAGWKGIAAEVVFSALDTMKHLYTSDMKKIEVFIGPSAKKCCYEVQSDVCELFKKLFPLYKDIFEYKNGKIFLDLVRCMQYQLIQKGILIENIYKQFACCTICNAIYCSYRREKNQLRNINAVVLCE